MSGIFKRKRPKRFGEIAIERGFVSEDQINEALRSQREYREKYQIHKEIGAILTEKGILGPDDVSKILDEQEGQTGLMAWFTALFRMSR